MGKFAIDVVKRAAQRIGISISRYPPPCSFERQLGEFLSRMGINVVLDVGAFVGDYAMKLRESGYKERIVSFEPTVNSYDRLCKRMGHDCLWTGHQWVE